MVMYGGMTLKCRKHRTTGLNRNVCKMENEKYDAFEINIWEIRFENVLLLTYRTIISVHQ